LKEGVFQLPVLCLSEVWSKEPVAGTVSMKVLLHVERSRTGSIFVASMSTLHIEPWVAAYILGKEPRRGKPGVLPLLRELREFGVI
jgi:hypothetical protein